MESSIVHHDMGFKNLAISCVISYYVKKLLWRSDQYCYLWRKLLWPDLLWRVACDEDDCDEIVRDEMCGYRLMYANIYRDFYTQNISITPVWFELTTRIKNLPNMLANTILIGFDVMRS